MTFDWKEFFLQRAADYRRIAEHWRSAVEKFTADGQHDLAAFATHRANINDDWAKEAEEKANQPTQ